MDSTDRLTEARTRLHKLGIGLCAVLDPVGVASSFAAIAATILSETRGRAAAAQFLRDLGDELEADEDAPRPC